MSREFYIRILKPVPDKFHQDKVFEDTEIEAAGLEHHHYEGLPDSYHVNVKSRSVYASMDDIKAYLKEKLPDKSFNTWGMRRGFGDTRCFGDDWTYNISDDIMDSLKRPHIADITVIQSVQSWEVDASRYDSQWLSDHCPMYLTDINMENIYKWYLEHINEKDIEDLEWCLSESGSRQGDIFRSICEAAAYAKKVGGVGWIEWE